MSDFDRGGPVRNADFGSSPNQQPASALEDRAVQSYLAGDDEGCAEAWEAAHRLHVEAGRWAEAAQCSFWLAFSLMMRGQMAQAGAWLARTEATIRDGQTCSASGYVLIPALLSALHDDDHATARDLASRAAAMADEFADPDLAAFACLGDGQALLARGDVRSGTARLDQAMLAVSTGEVGPVTAGVVYCAVILECMQIFDLARATEWTNALSAWCDDQPGLVPYRGQCLVHRSQLQQLAGDWSAAIATVISACGRLADPPHPALGLARYQAAELHRLQGAYEHAETAYAQASTSGHDPMPGLALLKLARGDGEGAAAGIGRALSESGRSERPRLLAAAAEILREVGDIAGARRTADELRSVADASSSEVLKAMADQAVGSVLLAEGDPAGAFTHLRAAGGTWTRLHMPHDGARTAVLLGLGCLAVGDRASAILEFDNARSAFETLGARPDLERLERLRTSARVQNAGSSDNRVASTLSPRELEVLTHVANGDTNREIAALLSISQHTVGRHLENIFTKLGVKGRAAATAYAYEHGLL